MAIQCKENRRSVGYNRIKKIFGWPIWTEGRIVPAKTADDVCIWIFQCIIFYELQIPIAARGIVQAHPGQKKSRTAWMHVGLYESRQNHLAFEVYYSSIWTYEVLSPGIIAHIGYSLTRYGNGLLGLLVPVDLFIYGVDSTIEQQQVCLGILGFRY
ncbi:Uncharacterised protein [uncultured archaeon]|nr:Uncharacterised protein [uncultured archaeon]